MNNSTNKKIIKMEIFDVQYVISFENHVVLFNRSKC